MPTNTLPDTVVADSSTVSAVPIEIVPDKKLSREDRKELGMEKAGLTDDLAWKTMMEGFEAKGMIVDKFGEEHSYVDHNVRHKFLDTYLRAKGYIRPDASIESTVNFNLTVTERQAIRTRLARGMASGKREVIDV